MSLAFTVQSDVLKTGFNQCYKCCVCAQFHELADSLVNKLPLYIVDHNGVVPDLPTPDGFLCGDVSPDGYTTDFFTPALRWECP